MINPSCVDHSAVGAPGEMPKPVTEEWRLALVDLQENGDPDKMRALICTDCNKDSQKGGWSWSTSFMLVALGGALGWAGTLLGQDYLKNK